MIENCIFVGSGAGSEIKKGYGIVIIGDNIHNLETKEENIIRLGDNVIIGNKLFGKDNILYTEINKLRKEGVENSLKVQKFSEELEQHQQYIGLYGDKRMANCINSAFIPYYTNANIN